MRMVLEKEDILNMVSMERDNLLVVRDNGQLYVSGSYLEVIVKKIVKAELEANKLMDEEKR